MWATDFKLNNQTCRFLWLMNLKNMASQKMLRVCSWCGEDCDHHASPKWWGRDTRSPQNGKTWKNAYNEECYCGKKVNTVYLQTCIKTFIDLKKRVPSTNMLWQWKGSWVVFRLTSSPIKAISLQLANESQVLMKPACQYSQTQKETLALVTGYGVAHRLNCRKPSLVKNKLFVLTCIVKT